MEPEPLPWRTRKVHDFLCAYVAANGFCPSMREIANGVGLSSASSVSHQLDQLAARGYIERGRYQARKIRLLKGAPGDGAGGGNRAQGPR